MILLAPPSPLAAWSPSHSKRLREVVVPSCANTSNGSVRLRQVVPASGAVCNGISEMAKQWLIQIWPRCLQVI